MFPELFTIPFTSLTIKGFGLMMVLGFIAAMIVIHKLSKGLGHNPDNIKSAALYSLISGIAGARIFYVIHYWDSFKDNPIEALYVWQGGLELLGGVLTALATIILYLRKHKLPIRRYMDILAIGLMIALAFGRVGCLFNGCCFGKPAELPWSITFPYNSIPYNSQAYPDPARERDEPYFTLPSDFFLHYYNAQGQDQTMLQSEKNLTPQQRYYLHEHDLDRCLPVHPTQIYSSINAILLFAILYLFWRRTISAENGKGRYLSIYKPGTTFSLMFVLYGPSRFVLEAIRDNNPYEIAHLTVSQLIGIGLFVMGIVSIGIFSSLKKPDSVIN